MDLKIITQGLEFLEFVIFSPKSVARAFVEYFIF